MLLSTNWTNVLIMTGIGIGVVFAILVLLVLILQLFNYVSSKSSAPVKAAATQTSSAPENTSDGERAAIATALYLYFNEAHDEESYTLPYRHNEHSAWNSELFNTYNQNR